MKTYKEAAQEVCFKWVKSSWDTYEDWLSSENGIGLWKAEIADIALALKEFALEAAREQGRLTAQKMWRIPKVTE